MTHEFIKKYRLNLFALDLFQNLIISNELLHQQSLVIKTIVLLSCVYYCFRRTRTLFILIRKLQHSPIRSQCHLLLRKNLNQICYVILNKVSQRTQIRLLQQN